MEREQLLLVFSLPIYVIVIGAEILFSHLGDRKWYNIKESFMNLYLTILNMFFDVSMRGFTLLVFAWATRFTFFQWESKNWLYWVCLGLGVDFFYYWLHRLDHSSRLFWAIHVTHHSAIEYNITTGFRSSVFEPLYRFAFYTPLPFMGFDAIDILFTHSLLQIYGVFVHTRAIKKLPVIIEYIFVTPGHHRVHHGSNIRYLDRNMSMTLIIWDRMFGTFQAELEEDPVIYGLTTNPEDRGYVNMVVHEWKAIWQDITRQELTWKERLGYVFKAPGWSHDDSRLTSKQLREKMKM
jgi:sterol desaturase/sphingolipid hydroxylase (fatty acid hydroxylase superfamily)